MIQLKINHKHTRQTLSTGSRLDDPATGVILDAIFKDAPYSEELDLDEHDVSLVDATSWQK